MRRLFFAIDLPDAHRKALTEVRRESWNARWVRQDRLHLTMRFVGKVGDEVEVKLLAGMADLPKKPGLLTVRGVGAFPNRRRPRVLYAGLDVAPEILALQHEIESLVQGAGISSAERDWTPHITLARFRNRRVGWLDDALEAYRDLELPAFEPEEVLLYESRLRSGPAQYLARGRCRLS